MLSLGRPKLYRRHRVLLEDVPRGRISKSVHPRFESEYASLYTKLISASERSGTNPRSEVRAHVLSAAIRTLRSPALKQELVHLVDAYLVALEND
jgi:hypothetical protein